MNYEKLSRALRWEALCGVVFINIYTMTIMLKMQLAICSFCFLFRSYIKVRAQELLPKLRNFDPSFDYTWPNVIKIISIEDRQEK